MKIKVTGSVLCYNLNDERYETIQSICSRAGIKIRRATDEDFMRTVGQSMGFSGAQDFDNGEALSKPDKTFSDEMMVLYHVSGTSLNTFLRKLRDLEIDVPLKAALTNTNKDWLPSRLCEELKREHEAMNAANKGDAKSDVQ